MLAASALIGASLTGRAWLGRWAWEAERNAAESSIDWRFTAEEARIKLKRLYPKVVEEP